MRTGQKARETGSIMNIDMTINDVGFTLGSSVDMPSLSRARLKQCGMLGRMKFGNTVIPGDVVFSSAHPSVSFFGGRVALLPHVRPDPFLRKIMAGAELREMMWGTEAALFLSSGGIRRATVRLFGSKTGAQIFVEDFRRAATELLGNGRPGHAILEHRMGFDVKSGVVPQDAKVVMSELCHSWEDSKSILVSEMAIDFRSSFVNWMQK